MALFAECARQADPEFSLTPEFAPLAARVVTRLDGMPLAIELAAARIKTLGMAGLADRIDDGPRLLDGEDALAPDRHQSLAAVADYDWSVVARDVFSVYETVVLGSTQVKVAAANGEFP